MKVGIVTIVDYTNYGNRLQNYAVYYILKKKFGCKAVTLTSYKEKPFFNGHYIVWFKTQIVKQICHIPKIAEKRFGSTITRWANFRFWSKKIPTKSYYEKDMIPQAVNEKYDVFIAGSDQIWNYHFSSHKFNDYFLRFASDEKKIALSGSFGVEDIPDEWKQIYVEGLTPFAHISVREQAGQNIIKKLLGKEVPVLIDPVMMLTKKEWLKVAKPPRVDVTKPYVLKYYLGEEKEEDKIDLWAKQNGYEVYELLNEKIPEVYSAGPGEFISLINNAALVCSDSFHCIVMSIIFSRPFIVYSRIGAVNDMSTRLYTLLTKFGFENRWKNNLKEEEYMICDYSNVDKVLEKERKKFIEYLSESLKDAYNSCADFD